MLSSILGTKVIKSFFLVKLTLNRENNKHKRKRGSGEKERERAITILG